jgi:hypothetical protein
MKIQDASIVLNKPVFYTSETVTGKLVIKTQDPNLGKHGIVFLKLYDKLDIEWAEDEMVSVGITRRSYNNFKKPFQLNLEVLLDHKNVVTVSEDDDEYKFEYPFEFQLPEQLQGRLVLKYAKCQYFIKAYLTNDESTGKHYREGVNVFDEFFKSLNHTYAKEEVVILNKTSFLPPICEKHVVEAKSPRYKVTVTLPKIIFSRGENIHVRLEIAHVDENDSSTIDLHKVGFKLFQVVKLTSFYPRERQRLFENLISHSSRKHLKGPNGQAVILEEFMVIPKELASSSSRNVVVVGMRNESRSHLNPIRVNYKINFEIWRNFLVDELDVNVPILIDPEI